MAAPQIDVNICLKGNRPWSHPKWDICFPAVACIFEIEYGWHVVLKNGQRYLVFTVEQTA